VLDELTDILQKLGEKQENAPDKNSMTAFVSFGREVSKWSKGAKR
jgi:hypothetical protein